MSMEDQIVAKIRDEVPRLWWNIYQGCLQQGFNALQAFTLLQTWILSQGPGGCRPNACEGPKDDMP